MAAKHKSAAKRRAGSKPKQNTKPKTALSRVTTADRIALGPTAAAVKAKSTPKDWKKIVTAAHGRGFTVQSALSDVPDELKARTQTSLRESAQRRVNEVYQPQETELNYQTQQVEGVRQKRLADEQVFGNWLTQRTSEIANAANAAQAKYQGIIDKYSTDTANDAAASNARMAARAQAGASGDVSGSIYLQGGQERNQARVELARNQAAGAAALGPIRASEAGAIRLSALGDISKARGQVEADAGKARSEIFGNRLKMTSDKAAALAEQYATDLKTEMDKAAANRDFDTMQSQLEDKSQQRAQEHAEFIIGQRTQRRGQTIAANTTRAGQKLTASTTRAGQKLTASQKAADRRQRSSDAAADRAFRATQSALDRSNRLAAARLGASNKVDGPEALKASRGAVQAIHTLGNMIRGQKAGKLWDADAKAWRPTRQVLRRMGATDDQINVALRWARGARGAKAIRNPGLLGIRPEDVGLI